MDSQEILKAINLNVTHLRHPYIDLELSRELYKLKEVFFYYFLVVFVSGIILFMVYSYREKIYLILPENYKYVLDIIIRFLIVTMICASVIPFFIKIGV